MPLSFETSLGDRVRETGVVKPGLILFLLTCEHDAMPTAAFHVKAVSYDVIDETVSITGT